MNNFPIWSDLGNAIGSHTENVWQARLAQLEEYRSYFDGDVFDDNASEYSSSEDSKEFPVELNLTKMLCLAQADAVYGHYDDAPVSFKGPSKDRVKRGDLAAITVLEQIVRRSSYATLWELELDRNIYGGCAIKVSPPTKKVASGIRWYRVPAQNFYAIPDPDDPDEILEAYVVTMLSQEQANMRYGYTGDKKVVQRVEHWTASEYTNEVDGIAISQFSGKNPYGVVPFVYIPRFRSNNWYGDALTPDIMAAQDELNMRVADIGEAINYNAHPTRWGRNLPSAFTADNFELSPNALWDLGRTVGNSPPPEVGMLEAQSAVSPSSFQYVDFIYDWARTSQASPPVAFGEDDGGGQRSGATLEIRMWPLIKAIQRSRLYLNAGFDRLISVTAAVLSQKDYKDIPNEALASLSEGRIEADFASIMPRDHAAAVDEVVKLASMSPIQISTETAQEALGRGAAEVARLTLERTERQAEAEAAMEKERQNDNAEDKDNDGGSEDSVSNGRASSVSRSKGDKSGSEDSK